MSTHIVPFSPELLPQAAVLLAQRHQHDRTLLPALPDRFTDPAVAGLAIEAALQRKGASGFAALVNDQVVAYLIGDMVIDNTWGRSAWVRTAGCAYTPAVGVEIVRELYAALGARWVAYGIFLHVALMPVSDPALLQAWFSLSFGMEQVHALVDLATVEPTLPSLPPALEIRQAGPADRHHLAAMSDVIWQTQVKAPVWGIMMPEGHQELADGWAELVDEADVTVWLACQAGQVVGCQGYWPAEQRADNLLIPESCMHLSVAGTRETARGQGIGACLTRYGFAHARAAGYRFCEADWRSTNLLAARFWPRQGFQPVAYRLVRRVDPRIAWADGRRPV